MLLRGIASWFMVTFEGPTNLLSMPEWIEIVWASFLKQIYKKRLKNIIKDDAVYSFSCFMISRGLFMFENLVMFLYMTRVVEKLELN